MSIKNLKIKRLDEKFNNRRVGLFKIKKRFSNVVYPLNIPKTIKLRLYSFYVALLELALKNVRINTKASIKNKKEE